MAKKKNNITSVYCLDTVPYYPDAILILANTAPEAARYINNTYPEHTDKCDEELLKNAAGFQDTFSYLEDGVLKNRFVVCILYRYLNDTTPEHETIHLAWAILHWAGVKLTPNNHEALTFFYEYLLKQVRDIIKQHAS
jgi:hypothetical protein